MDHGSDAVLPATCGDSQASGSYRMFQDTNVSAVTATDHGSDAALPASCGDSQASGSYRMFQDTNVSTVTANDHTVDVFAVGAEPLGAEQKKANKKEKLKKHGYINEEMVRLIMHLGGAHAYRASCSAS